MYAYNITFIRGTLQTLATVNFVGIFIFGDIKADI